MHKPLDAVADVDKGSEVADAPYDPVEFGARLEDLEHLRAGLGGLLLDHRPPGEHEPPGRRHDLRDEAVERLPHHLLEVLNPPGAHQARGHEAPQSGHLALEATLVGCGHTGLDDHARLELRPVLDRDRPVGRGHLEEAVFGIAAADAHSDQGANLGNLFLPLEKAGEFHRALSAAAEVNEGGVGSDR